MHLPHNAMHLPLRHLNWFPVPLSENIFLCHCLQKQRRCHNPSHDHTSS